VRLGGSIDATTAACIIVSSVLLLISGCPGKSITINGRRLQVGYKIYRHYADENKAKELIASGLTMDEAQDHCHDPNTSSKTATEKVRTECPGEWFDGYVPE